AGDRDGGRDGALVRFVHQPPRVRGRVPEGDQHRLHRAHEPRLRQGAVQAAAVALTEALSQARYNWLSSITSRLMKVWLSASAVIFSAKAPVSGSALLAWAAS